MLACHVLGLLDNDLRVARGERKQEQNRLVGILSTAASSPFPPKILGTETVIMTFPLSHQATFKEQLPAPRRPACMSRVLGVDSCSNVAQFTRFQSAM
jgi:hypothetical protein